MMSSAAALLLLMNPPMDQIEAGERLILMGQDGTEWDACAGYGEVRGLKADGDGFLSVRIAPGTSSREKDRITNGQAVAMCDSHGDWIGVVYRKSGDEPEFCGTGTPSAYVGAYRGPCRYGWVHKNYVLLMAG